MKKFISLLIIVFLLGGPLTIGYAHAEAPKKLTANLNADEKPRNEKSGKSASYNPDDYPLVENNDYIDTLVDSFSAYHSFTFNSLTSLSDELKLSLLYQISAYSGQEPYTTLEFYKEDNGSLTYLTQAYFYLSFSGTLTLSVSLPKSLYAEEEFVYVRVGTSNSLSDTYYSDTTRFKVKNPDFSGGSGSEDYVIISNESTYAEGSQSTGSLQVNNEKYTFDKKLDLGAYQIDANKPFNIEKNKDKMFSKQQTEKMPDYQTGDQKPFWVTNFSSNQDYQINASLVHSGSKTNIWVHDNQISAADAKKLSDEFDSSIHPTVVSHFAPESDVNGDGKINILVYDIQDGFTGSGGYIGGYFYGGDLYNMTHSNQSEIFYIDTYPLMGMSSYKAVENSYETLAHEFQHMVNYNQNVFIEGKTNMDTWLNEALSMAAEQIYTGQALTSRIDYYNASNSIKNGHSLLYWDRNGDTLANYSLSYLFGQYVRIQANQGNRIFKDILQDPNNDYRAVENAVQKYYDPTLSFGKFMTNFRGALLLKNKTGEYGFKGEPAFDALSERVYGGSSTYLRGGGALVKKTNTADIPADKGNDVSYTFISAEEQDTAAPAAPAVNLVSDHDNVISGTTEPNAMVYIKKGTETLGNAYANETGAFSAGIQVQQARTELKVYAVDAAGNKSEESTVIVQDRTAPSVPQVNPVGDNQTAVTGKAEAGSKIYVKKGSTALGHSAANSSGVFSAAIAKQPAGTTLILYSEDAAGNKSGEITIKVQDKTAPAIPIVDPVGDNHTIVTGKAEANSTLTVKTGTTTLGEAKANSAGVFSVDIKTKQKAGITLSIYSKDATGNQSSSASIQVADKTAPAKPTVDPVADNQTIVTGKAEAASTVTVKNGTTTLGEAKANSAGVYSVDIKTKQKAGITLSIYAKDAAGNQSAAASVQVADKTAPTIPAVNPVADNQTIVTGKAEANSIVTVKSGTTTLGEAKADSNGVFSIDIKTKQIAGTTLSIYAKDAAGNQSAAVSVRVADKTAPPKPAVDPVADNQTIVTGKAEANSTVTIKNGTTTLGEAKANSTGGFSIDIKTKQKAGITLSIYAKDAAGNQSTAASVQVADKTAPDKPTVDSIDDSQSILTGKAEANSTVTVKNGTTTLGEAKANSAGVFSVDIQTKLTSGTILTIYTKDAAGNKSPSITVEVTRKTMSAKPTVTTVGDNTTVITGKADANSTVYLKNRGATIGTAITDSSGNFSITLKEKQKARAILLLYSVNDKGNRSPILIIKVSDQTAPKTPTVKKLSSRSTFVTGKAEIGSTVYVYNGTANLGKTTVRSKGGVYRVKIKAQKKGTTLSVYAEDKAGNKSGKKDIIVR
ncbi:Ig-like domain-containing protein [Metabacillus idriensis]|uniref:Ig-like domain-containing protein n=1 Tax=Metabacillus idriensis TaxID=324768 RepID=UPI001748E4B0|nr:Ig-like domain-containing protein [Metabacillus idriensis]